MKVKPYIQAHDYLNVLQRTEGIFFPLMPGILYKQKGTSCSCIYHFAVYKLEGNATL
jgi:hypothetical protein